MLPRAGVAVCVGAAIFRGDRVLLVRRAKSASYLPGWWDIPGGHVEPGEDLVAALRREVREETGLRVAVGRPFYGSIYPYRSRRGTTVPTLDVDFLCVPLSPREPTVDPAELSEHRWVSAREVPRARMAALLVKVLRAAFVAHRSLGIRSADPGRGRCDPRSSYGGPWGGIPRASA